MDEIILESSEDEIIIKNTAGRPRKIAIGKESMAIYQKEYQQKRKENAKYLICECGCENNYNYKHQHIKSKNHQRFKNVMEIKINEFKNKISSFF